jgi:hypothetical protein
MMETTACLHNFHWTEDPIELTKDVTCNEAIDYKRVEIVIKSSRRRR